MSTLIFAIGVLVSLMVSIVSVLYELTEHVDARRLCQRRR